MTRFSRRAKKWFAALIGIAVLIGLQTMQVESVELREIVVQLIVGALAAEGVYQVSNDA